MLDERAQSQELTRCEEFVKLISHHIMDDKVIPLGILLESLR